MKRTGILCLLVALAMLCACAKKPKAENNAPLPAEVPAAAQAAAEEPAPEESGGGAAEYVLADERLQPGERIADGRRVFYEIFTGSFSDSDGDGTGDLRGVLRRLDYLNDGDPASGRSLGIGGIWLTPVFPSPSYHKYDVVDYFSVDPAFGTMEELEALIAECHARDVLLILDLPLNHSSDRNEWFRSFAEARRTGDTANEYYDFYSCYDSSSEQAPAGRTFRQVADSPVYYECNFSGDMPEFNFDSQAVRERLLDVVRETNGQVVLGFVLRATPFYGRIRDIVDSGRIGRVSADQAGRLDGRRGLGRGRDHAAVRPVHELLQLHRGPDGRDDRGYGEARGRIEVHRICAEAHLASRRTPCGRVSRAVYRQS